MKPAPFALHAPRALDGVLAALAEHGEAARILAGGQSLVPLMNLRLLKPEVLVSINGCAELDYIRRDGDELVIGARVRQAQAEAAEAVIGDCPLLALALPLCGGQANRNRATICGSLAHADPLAELPAVALALDAGLEIASRRRRWRVAATEFFRGALTTCLEPGEMLAAVRVPRARPGERHAFLELGNRRHGFAVAGVAVRLQLDGQGRCTLARLALIGAGDGALRATAAEQALLGARIDAPAIAAAVAAATGAIEPPSDVHADADYRRRALGVLIARALAEAVA